MTDFSFLGLVYL